jgi:DNA-binding MarR family transcriptional regulator
METRRCPLEEKTLTARTASSAPAPLRGADASALDALIGETTQLFHRLKAVAEQVHGQGEVSAGRRGVLRSLAREGPRSVPQLARSRPVSRQLVQTLVNGLLEEGYVEKRPNPAHRRSPLLRLTPAGRRFVAAMERRERELLSGLRLEASREELEAAASTLRRVRAFFEGERWQRRVRAT